MRKTGPGLQGTYSITGDSIFFVLGHRMAVLMQEASPFHVALLMSLYFNSQKGKAGVEQPGLLGQPCLGSDTRRYSHIPLTKTGHKFSAEALEEEMGFWQASSNPSHTCHYAGHKLGYHQLPAYQLILSVQNILTPNICKTCPLISFKSKSHLKDLPSVRPPSLERLPGFFTAFFLPCRASVKHTRFIHAHTYINIYIYRESLCICMHYIYVVCVYVYIIYMCVCVV